jgi:cation diffusion facilitator CzcD-associated flavoprotein CzcO
MAIGYPYRLGAGGVPDCTAKTTTSVSRHIDPHKEHNYAVAAPPLVSKRCGGFLRFGAANAGALVQPESRGPMVASDQMDVAIVGGGPGGVIALYYARQAGLKAVLLEKQDTVGGLWAQLPAWQDIQNRAEDWTLGDLPIAGVDQPSILANIQQWVHKFDLGQHIRLGTTAISASPTEQGWTIATVAGELRAKALISATGVHNRPIIPDVERGCSDVAEVHSSMLRDPTSLSGKRVVVAGGGASAFDLIDLCLEYGAAQIAWVHHSLKWMVPTRKPKRFASNLRELAKRHMLGESAAEIGSVIDAELRARYQKFGMEELLPDAPDVECDGFGSADEMHEREYG